MAWILYHPPNGEEGTELNPFLWCSPSPFWIGDSTFYFLSDGQSREILGTYGSWYPPVTLNPSTTYTWYIEHWSYDDPPVLRGTSPTYSFTTTAGPTPPSKAINPTPEHEDTGVDFSDFTISWENGGGATSYDMYFGQGATLVPLGNQAGTSKVVPIVTSPKDYYNEGDNAYQASMYASSWESQTITANSSYDLKKLRLKLFREGLPGILTISIKAVVDGKPSGADLVFTTIDGDLLTTNTSGQWKIITLPSIYSVGIGDKFAIVVRRSGADGPKFGWRVDSTAPSYSGGCRVRSTDSGETWTEYPDRDFMFETHEEDIDYSLGELELDWNLPFNWRIDAKNDDGTTTGDVWNFSTSNLPAKPVNPTPANGEEHVSVYLGKIEWEDGNPENPADSYDVYFSKVGQIYWPIKLGSTSNTYFLLPSSLYTSENYNWRVDAVNESGTTTGDMWYFTTQPVAGWIRAGFSLGDEGVGIAGDIAMDDDKYLYISGDGHPEADFYYPTLKKVDPDTGEVLWTALSLNNSLCPGKLCFKDGYIYTAGPTYPRKFDADTGAEEETYTNIYGDGGVGVDASGNVYSCGPVSEDKNVWKSNSAGSSQSSVLLGAGILKDILVIGSSVFVCGDYDESEDCDIWKLDSDLNVVERYKTGGNSRRIVKVPDEDEFYVVHDQADDGGDLCHVTKFNTDLTVLDRILLDEDMEYQDFDQIPTDPEWQPDMYPSEILNAILTNKRCLAGLDPSYIDYTSLGEVLQFCIDNNIRLSITLDAQKALLAWLDYVQSHYLGFMFMGG